MNIGGVHSMLEFCKTLPKLVSFVHISTAYANCDRNKIDEEVYEPPLKPRQLLDACSCVSCISVLFHSWLELILV
ncbi:hypothetical protein DPMN_010533 [Dreissena polymorpha]|uniref:Thioester reductase (TE) domain-containing protein n=1 Tax=Dreissena polymorpha TaxID=45954 RepID=A0A9D4MYX6_DREPO|nr:hypothetical protein DPMN_010533 [Dreissena polymorpha]